MGAFEHVNPSAPLSVVLSAEQAVAGMLMREPQHLADVAKMLRPEHFEDEVCRAVYEAVLDCDEVGEQINPLTVCERLERNGWLERAGWVEGVVNLAISATGNPVSSAKIIVRDHQRAKMRRLGLRLIDATESRQIDPKDLASLVVTYARQFTGPEDQSRDLVVGVQQLHERHAAQSWAVKSIIPANSLGMFFGASGTFKSFIALDYALHRCYGLPWIGRRTQKGTPVYIAAEGGAGLMKRVEAWHKQRGMDWRKCPMRFVTTPLTMQTDAQKLRDAIDAMELVPSDIIIDTMSQTFAGEENSSTEVAAYLSHLGAALREPYAATVLVIHHTGHQASERPRGSSAIIANTDFLYAVYRDEKEPLATLECVKQKDGDRWGPVSFALRSIPLGHDEDGDEITSLAARHVSGADEIIAAAQSTSGASSGLLRLLQAVGTGAPESEVRDRYYKLMPDADTEARRKAWNRAINRAEAQQIIVRDGDWLSKNGGSGA